MEILGTRWWRVDVSPNFIELGILKIPAELFVVKTLSRPTYASQASGGLLGLLLSGNHDCGRSGGCESPCRVDNAARNGSISRPAAAFRDV
jgi:hypothetical protein